MAETRKGRQTPTQSVTLPYWETKGQEAIDCYNETDRIAQEWQELLIYDILAVGEDGLWVHTKFGLNDPVKMVYHSTKREILLSHVRII